MKRALVVVGILGCGGAKPTPTPPPIANQAAPAPQHPEFALDREWPTQTGKTLAVLTPAGPFATLDAVCVALGRVVSDDKFEGCHVHEQDALGGGAIKRIGEINAWDPAADSQDMPARVEYAALETARGWYVLPRIGDTGNRYSSLFVQAERAEGRGVLIRYEYDLATAGRFASEVEHGVIACDVVDGNVGCTPKLPTLKYRTQMDTSQPDWPSSTDVELACTATYRTDGVTIAPAPDPADGGTWTAEAADACTHAAYTGTHALDFR